MLKKLKVHADKVGYVAAVVVLIVVWGWGFKHFGMGVLPWLIVWAFAVLAGRGIVILQKAVSLQQDSIQGLVRALRIQDKVNTESVAELNRLSEGVAELHRLGEDLVGEAGNLRKELVEVSALVGTCVNDLTERHHGGDTKAFFKHAEDCQKAAQTAVTQEDSDGSSEEAEAAQEA